MNDYILQTGKLNKGKVLDDISLLYLDWYRGYLEKKDTLSPKANKDLLMIQMYLDQPLIKNELERLIT